MAIDTSTRVNSRPFRPTRAFSDEVAEHYRTVLRELNWPSPQSRHTLRTLGVTSCYSGEGVTTVAAQLAATAAGSGKHHVLLADANLARPGVHRVFDTELAPGFAEFLDHDGEVFVLTDDNQPACICPSGVPQLDILTAGNAVENRSRLYDSTGLADALETLSEGYDLVVFDLPAAGQSSTTCRLSGLLDGVLLVVESERVRREVAQRMVAQLQRSHTRLLGAVLNKRQAHVPGWLYRTL